MLCLNPQEAERQWHYRQQVLTELASELTALDKREDDHPKAACRPVMAITPAFPESPSRSETADEPHSTHCIRPTSWRTRPYIAAYFGPTRQIGANAD